MTTETTTWVVRVAVSSDCVGRYVIVRVWLAPCLTPTHGVGVWLVVGLGVDRIVDVLRLLLAHPPHPHGVRVLVGCCCLCWPISTSQLRKPLPVFHCWPINPVVCWGPTKKDKSFLWRPYLEDGFPLRCFQRLPFPNVANQPCPGRDNWHTRGSSVPVLSY